MVIAKRLNYTLEYILHRKVVYHVVLGWLLFMRFAHFLSDPPCHMDTDSSTADDLSVDFLPDVELLTLKVLSNASA